MSLTLMLAMLVIDPASSQDCDKPVYMVVAGPTHDRVRMQAYAKGIFDSGLYQRLGGYYINAPIPLAVFEGAPPKGHANLIVRFPCLANAKAFWFSKEYQEKIMPLRLNPSAGDYTVTVYAEIPLRSDLADKVETADYLARFDSSGIEQIEQGAKP
jgi:uncharacterized protein (DUF1330 family)